jgi:proteasome lid subunit RPN8/RPN11
VILRLSASHRAALRDHALAAYPKECCGLLIGRDGEGAGEGDDRRDGKSEAAPSGTLLVTKVLPSVNQDPAGGARAFEVDPELILTWHKRLRGTPERIVGHYHSHPDEPARPSATDLERAWEPGMIWLIVGVGRGLAEIAAFQYQEEGRGPAMRRTFEPVQMMEG